MYHPILCIIVATVQHVSDDVAARPGSVAEFKMRYMSIGMCLMGVLLVILQ